MANGANIIHENGRFVVWRGKDRYEVLCHTTSFTHATVDAAFALDADGLSLAIAYSDYRASRDTSWPPRSRTLREAA